MFFDDERGRRESRFPLFNAARSSLNVSVGLKPLEELGFNLRHLIEVTKESCYPGAHDFHARDGFGQERARRGA